MLLLFQVLLIAASFSTSSLAEQDLWSPKCKASHSGQEYKGSEFVTQTGRRCKFWESLGADEKVAHNVSDAALPDGSLRKARNFCRNPSAAPDGPWCVTSDPSVVTDACDVPLCRVKDCRRTGPGVEYAGAATLENCRRWSKLPGSRFPEGSRAAAGRSCRNPDGDPGGPWCKVEKKGDARGYCYVPFCDEHSACLTYTGGAAPSDHYTRLPEAVEGNNVSLAVKLWDPARWAAANVTVTLSRTAHAGAADSLVLRVTGGGRWDLLSGVEEPTGGQASAEEGDGLPLLSGLRWATLWLAWEEDAVSVGVVGREEPLGTGRLTVKPLEDLKYYSVVGGGEGGLLWEPPFCGGGGDNESDCEEHVTTGAAEFAQFREMGDGQEAKVSVRAAGQWAAVELRVAPTLPVPRFRVTLGGDNVTTVSLKVDPSAPSTVLLRQRTEGLLDYWKWRHLSVSVTREVLLVVWEDKGVTLGKVEHPQVANLRWFSVGSRQATAHWTLGCRLPDPPRAAPPECLLSASGDYSGSQWVTSRGLPCLPWTHPEAKGAGLGAAHVNYCRNPDGDRGGPWCYVVGVKGEVHRQSCRVRECLNLECRMAGTANDYVGKVNTTRSGRRCRKWKKAEPEVDAALFPERSVVGARNFCRDPSRNVGGPWCWTDDPLVPRDLCHVPDCDEREECVALTRGSTEGRRVLMQPTWRTKGLAFALKEWDPDQRDSVEWHVWPPPDEGHHRHLRLDVAEEKVRLFLVTTEGGGGEEKELLLREKELAHLIPVGQWGRFRLAVAKGRLRLAYEGAEAALFEWQGGALSGAYFEPRHVGYASLVGRTVGVAFPCDDCHTETTTTRLFTKILPVGLWRPPSSPTTTYTPPSELTIHARGPEGATLRVALLQMPGLGDYHALTLGEGGDRVYWLRQVGGAVKVLKAVRLPFPLLRGDAWTRFRLRWTEDTIRLYVGDTLFLRERDPRPLLFYFFTVGAEGGAVTWTANCDPPDLDGPTVDGGWSEWQPAQCSASCGGGVGMRTRTCTRPPPSALGRDCEGDAAQEEVCNAFPCGVLSPDTLEILREERGRRAFALEAAPGAEVTMACGDALTMTRVMREAPDAKLLWAADGRAVRGGGNASTRLTVRAARSAVYTCSLEGGGVPRRLLLRATALAVRAALTVRATTPLTLDCEGLPLGLLYDHLEVRWELRGRLWRDYGVVVPAAVETTRVDSANASHQGVWRCLVEQRELGFLWLTNWVNVTVLPPPTFLTHLMEDPLPAKVFGKLANETQVLVVLICAASSFVALVVGLTVAYLRFCRLP